MAKKPEPPPQLTNWSIYKIGAKAVRLGAVEAPEEAGGITETRGDATISGSGQELLSYRRGPQ
jgi:hypothetical protein